MFTRRTDLALEARELWQESAEKTTRLSGVKAVRRREEGYPVTRVEILDQRGEEALKKPRGQYITIDLSSYWQRKTDFFERAVRAVGSQLKELLPEEGSVLIIGLGNAAMTPDAVGPLAADSVLITRHLIAAMPRHFAGFRPVAVFRADNGEIIWANDGFLALSGTEEDIFDLHIQDLAEGLDPRKAAEESAAGLPVEVGAHSCQVYSTASRVSAQESGAVQVVTAYFVDVTEARALQAAFEASRLVVAILVLDNYEEMMKAGGDAGRSSIQAQVDELTADVASQVATIQEQEQTIQAQAETIQALEAAGTAAQVEEKLEAAYQEGVESNG